MDSSEARTAQRIVQTKLREKAVPQIILELNHACSSRAYDQMLAWQWRFPAGFRVLPEQEETGGTIAAAASGLGQMGEAAWPAIPALARCLDRSPMRFAENLEGMDELIVMGPVAEAALPCLRRIVSEANPSFKEIAGLAICTIEGPTDAQVQAAGRQRAGGNPLREDPVLSALLPRQLGQVITNEGRPPSEREIAWNPGLTRLPLLGQ